MFFPRICPSVQLENFTFYIQSFAQYVGFRAEVKKVVEALHITSSKISTRQLRCCYHTIEGEEEASVGRKQKKVAD